MGHASKTVVSALSRLASVSGSSLSKFPPAAALIDTGGIPKPFSPEIWASLQPPPPSALSAFAHRIGLSSVLTSTQLIQQACTHPTFTPYHERYNTRERAPPTNGQLSAVGNALMGMFAAEYVQASYPYLPTRVIKAVVTAHVGPVTSATVAQEMGATPLLRWHRMPNLPTKPGVLHAEALASIPRSITALLYQKRSLMAARQFVHSYFLTRKVDAREMIKFRNPKKALLELINKFGRDRPNSRLLKETGRYSNTPVFVVGIYTGSDQLGEGFGSSLRMAEYRAAENALHRVYLTRVPSDSIELPSSAFPSVLGDIYQKGEEGSYVAPQLTESEIMYASSGKTARIALQSVRALDLEA